MKLLPNINKSVPEASDPALIKPVSDAIEAVDTALGAKPSTLTTTAKTIVPAINELQANGSLQYVGALNATTIDNPPAGVMQPYFFNQLVDGQGVYMGIGYEYVVGTERYGAQLRIHFAYGISFRKLNGGVWSAWNSLHS